jgi:RHH-type proline utilization regulon transcriptional repressor/proline dehydrogenase/delta 1-pyrroline-5-carboxylate dehydrogenase
MLEEHAARMDPEAQLVCSARPRRIGGNVLRAARLRDRPSLDAIDREVFGRSCTSCASTPRSRVPCSTRSTPKGYGLTMGVHSRIEDTDRFRAARARLAGNLYVNRNMIGATSACSPFGGEALGTGPRRAGPTTSSLRERAHLHR